jgi:sec-independent protein translocase protein TatA
MFNLGLPEVLVLFAVVILIFGATRLPELGRGIGEGIRNFKKSLRDDQPEEEKKKT